MKLRRDTINRLFEFIDFLEEKGIYHELKHFQKDIITVELDLPGEKWEIDFNDEGIYYIERFVLDESIRQEDMMEYLMEEFIERD